MGRNRSNAFMKGALLLTLAGMVGKVLSAGYRIPLQNLTGDLGFYIYQQVYPFLGMAFILSLYGFPSAISKIAVELKSEGKSLSFSSLYIPIFLIMLAINGVFFVLLFLNAYPIALWMGDTKLADAFRYASFTFLLIPFTALFRGIFQGDFEMKPTAYSQVSEQFSRVLIIIFAALFFALKGTDIYEIGQAGAIASIIGAFTAVFVLVFFFIKQKPVACDAFLIPWKYYIKTIFIFGLVAALNHMVLLVIQFADAFTLVPGLRMHGLSLSEAMEAKGIFDRGQPLIQLGTVIGSSFALALIPALSAKKLKENPENVHYYMRSALLVSFYLAAGAATGLIAIFTEANLLLYQDVKGTGSLRILASGIFLSSIAITASSILQGLGYIKRTALFIAIAFFVKWVANQFLVPFLGIYGSAIATVCSLFTLCLLVAIALKRKLPKLVLLPKINWRAFLAAGMGMVGYIKLVGIIIPSSSFTSRGGLLLYVLFMIITGAMIYLIILIKGKAFTERELTLLPFAPQLIQLYKGRN